MGWSDEITDIKKDEKRKLYTGLTLLRKLTYYAVENASKLAKEIDKEKPDLILYDVLAKYFQYVMEYYTKWYNIAQRTSPFERANLEFSPTVLPRLVGFSPSFVAVKKVFPNKTEEKILFPPLLSIHFLFALISYFMAHFYRCFKCGFGFVNPFKYMSTAPIESTKFVMVAVFPELQARSHMLDKKMYKFIGSTLDETVKNEFSMDKPEEVLNKVFDQFKVTASKINILEEKEHLVYVSMGSLFHNNIAAYTDILEGIKSFDLGSNSHNIKLDNLKVIVSTGEYVFKNLTELIRRNEYSLPNNILLVKSVPQLEILKRASLFITHAGQNSVSESVHYGGLVKLYIGIYLKLKSFCIQLYV